MKNIYLHYNNLTDDDVEMLLPIIKNLDKLWINDNKLTSKAYVLLSDAIKNMEKVSGKHYLNLSFLFSFLVCRESFCCKQTGLHRVEICLYLILKFCNCFQHFTET